MDHQAGRRLRAAWRHRRFMHQIRFGHLDALCMHLGLCVRARLGASLFRVSCMGSPTDEEALTVKCVRVCVCVCVCMQSYYTHTPTLAGTCACLKAHPYYSHTHTHTSTLPVKVCGSHILTISYFFMQGEVQGRHQGTMDAAQAGVQDRSSGFPHFRILPP